MNEPHDFDREREFQDYLKRRRAPFPRPSNDGAEPPPELDRIVLERARAAVETDSPGPLRKTNLWALPVGLAATLALAFAVVLNVGPARVTQPVGAVVVVPAARETDEQPTARETDEQPTARETDEQATADVLAATEAESIAAASASSDVFTETEAEASASAPGSAGPERGAAVGSVDGSPTVARAQRQVVPMAREALKPATTFAAPPPPAIARSPAPTAENSQGADAARATADTATRREQSGPRAADYSSEETVRLQGEASTQSGTVADRARIANAKAREPAVGAAARAAASGALEATTADAVPAPAPAPVPGSATARDPAKWLEAIEALRRAGRTAEAERELAAFRKVFPTYERDRQTTPDR